ncbi:MAG: winged helix-turn-helix domain-containing protein [Acidobacteriota bacterium]
MPAPASSRRFRFGTYEADAATGELRRQGLRVKLNAQPFQLLLLLLERPGQLLTREEISAQLWPDGTFVDFDHGLNSAINRIREALHDSAANPRFVETLARRGYRFIAPVENVSLDASLDLPPVEPLPAPASPEPLSRYLASPEDLPRTPYAVVQTLFVLLQLMYLGYYVGALCNLPEIGDLLSSLPHPTIFFSVLTTTAALLIPARIFLLSAVLFHAPTIRLNFLRLWPLLLVLDLLWSLAPFLLLHHMSIGLAIACVPPLVYAPFAQRSLILMGAGAVPSRPDSSAS